MLPSQFGKTRPLYWVTRYTGLCKTRTVSPRETKDNRTLLLHCAPCWQVGQPGAKILWDVGLGRTLNLETLSGRWGRSCSRFEGHCRAVRGVFITDTLTKTVGGGASGGAAIWWGHTVGKRAEPPVSCRSGPGPGAGGGPTHPPSAPKCLF